MDDWRSVYDRSDDAAAAAFPASVYTFYDTDSVLRFLVESGLAPIADAPSKGLLGGTMFWLPISQVCIRRCQAACSVERVAVNSGKAALASVRRTLPASVPLA